MASFRFECNSKPNKNGKYVILLCVTINGIRRRTKTHIELTSSKQFNAKCKGDNWVRGNIPEAKKWNQELHDIIEEAKTTFLKLEDQNKATSENLVKKLKTAETSSSFIEFTKVRMDEILLTGSINNWKRYNGFLNKLEAFLKKSKRKDLLFSELTPDLLNQFDLYLRTISNERNPDRRLHPNTIHTILNKFKALVHIAVERNLIPFANNPFNHFSYSLVKTQKEKLDESELEALLALELEEGSLLWHCRNYFFFSFYCAGIRVADLIQLRWSNISTEGRLNYQMGKNHKLRDLILVDQAKSILKHYAMEGQKSTDYIFPLLNGSKPYAKAITLAEKDTLPIELKKQLLNDISAKTALINKYLKKLAELAGIEKKISMHISRHSFAKLAKAEGTDNSILQSLLAHSSVAITEGYMGSFDTSTTDKALKNIFNNNSQKPQISDRKAKLQAMLAELSEEELAEMLANVKRPQPSLM